MYPQLKMRPLPAALERKSLGDDDNISVEIKAALGNLTKSVGDRISKVETSIADFVEQRKSLDKHLADLEKSLLHGGGDPTRKSKAPETKAFEHYCRTGDMSQLKTEGKGGAMSAGVDPEGGFTVPSQINDTIEALALKQSAMRRLCTVVPSSTDAYTKIINKRGTAAQWVGEKQDRPETNTPDLAAINFPAGEIYAFPLVTQRLLDDSFFDLESWLGNELADAFTAAEGDAYINGNGINRPLGFLNLPNAPVATADGSRPYATLQYVPSGGAAGFAASNPADALFNLAYSLKPSYRAGSAWLMAPSTLNAIAQFKDSQGRYLLQPAITAGTPPSLLGYEIVEDENMPTIGAGAFPIAFGNWRRGYYIVDRFGVRILRDAFTQKPYVGFYATKRVSGAPVNYECIKLLKIATN
jgi:HK97 family phage major capsid protein